MNHEGSAVIECKQCIYWKDIRIVYIPLLAVCSRETIKLNINESDSMFVLFRTKLSALGLFGTG